MTKVFIKYNPYRLQTDIVINGREIEVDNILYRMVKDKRLQEWITAFPETLKHATNSVDFDLSFYGMEMDWDDVEFTFRSAKEKGIIRNISLHFEAGKTVDDITDKIVRLFEDLKDGPIEAFRAPSLIRAFENIRTAVFPINVIATMSSGKSTLINSLLACELMPSKNQACTATITEITDSDKDFFQAEAFDEANNVLEKVDNLTYEIMERLNGSEKVYRVAVKGNVPFIDANDIALQLVDTPGPNNSQNQAHKNTTYSSIKNGANNLILYVLNGTQIATTDDADLLDYVAKQISEGGKQVRDRFIFVINKMDSFNPEKEDIAKAVDEAKTYLVKHGINDPQIFPCSAYTALNIRTYLKNIDPEKLTWKEQNGLPSAARETLMSILKFNEFKPMHLEQYSVLAPSAQRDIDYRLSQATESGDSKEQTLVHCGIYSIEAAITAYVKKYAKTKKIKDLVDSFQEVLESSQVLAAAKEKVATDEEAAKAISKRAEAIMAKIASGEDAKEFKSRIAAFSPMDIISNKAIEMQDSAVNEAIRVFGDCDRVITDKSEAKRLVSTFANFSSNAMAKLSADLESIVNTEIVETGEALLSEYQEKLTTFDEEAVTEALDFNTVDLVKDALQNMRNSIKEWRSDSFATEQVEELGTTTKETKTYHVKTGQEAKEEFVGFERKKIGTQEVANGTERVYGGKRTIKNKSKSWWQFWKPDEIEEDYYIDKPVYTTVDVYDTFPKYKKIMRDIFEERTETVEKYEVRVDEIQTVFISKYRMEIDTGIENSLKYATEQIESLKKQFADSFDELDHLIAAKYTELDSLATNQKEKEQELEKNRRILKWIEDNKNEMNGLLDI